MEYYTLMSILESDLSLKDLRRIINSNKEYLVLAMFGVMLAVSALITKLITK